jgi:tRNA dimethylallyltransferase
MSSSFCPKQIALIGATASGKTALAIALAQKEDAYILSLDSLALYKEMDIVSAKPTPKERGGILHFGIDEIFPNEAFDVTTFIALYNRAFQEAKAHQKNLIIVGGTSFYLKRLLEGMSPLPPLSQEVQKRTKTYLQDLPSTYAWLLEVDPEMMEKIKPNDRYRIEKALHIYLATEEIPTAYFQQNPPIPTIQTPMDIYEIVWEREVLRQRIFQRTQIMMEEGLIDEIASLEAKYTRRPHAMKAIGVKETLAYFDGHYSKKMLIEKIATHTAQLAKRQTTFNKSQFEKVKRGSLEALKRCLL